MLDKFFGQLAAADVFVAGVVFHFGRHRHLPPRETLFDQDGLQGRPHRIYSGRHPSRPAADND